MAILMCCQQLRVAKVKCQILEWHKKWLKVRVAKTKFSPFCCLSYSYSSLYISSWANTVEQCTNVFISQSPQITKVVDRLFIYNKEISVDGCGILTRYFSRPSNIFFAKQYPQFGTSKINFIDQVCFGVTHLANMSPLESCFMVAQSFSTTHCKMQYVDEIMDIFLNSKGFGLRMIPQKPGLLLDCCFHLKQQALNYSKQSLKLVQWWPMWSTNVFSSVLVIGFSWT